MKTKIVLWGTNSEEAKVLLALQLDPEENTVAVWTFPKEVATEEFYKSLLQDWRDGKEVQFPEGYTSVTRELTASGGIIPEGIKVEKPDIVSRAQTEWHFIVLSSKLHQAYENELDDLQERVKKLEAYDHSAWDDLKQFWNKVREQMRDRNLFREHSDLLKNRTNELFSQLKELRSSLDAEFEAAAKVNYDKFSGVLQDIEDRLKGKANLFSIFEELKSVQRDFKNAKLTRELRSEVWARLDKIFKEVKERRFGSGGQMERLQRRHHGLLSAIKKMENSIYRDEEELQFQNRKVKSAYTGQLETQIRQAKVKMIEERIRSKKDKLEEMRLTSKELELKMSDLQIQMEKEAKAKTEKLAAAKAKAERLAKEAAERAAKAKAKVEEKTTEVADKVAEKVEDVASDVKNAVENIAEEVVEKTTTVIEKITDKISEVKSEENSSDAPVAEENQE